MKRVDGENYMETTDLAELLGISVRTIYNRRKAGLEIPPGVRIGRILLWRERDVKAWVDAKFVEGGVSRGSQEEATDHRE